jgi:putative hydrolase of the HAD superfamily
VALRGVVTLDALGTLVELRQPAPLLAAELSARGARVSDRQAGAAVVEEIAYYRGHFDLGADAASLALLRERCAAVLREALERAGADLGEMSQAVVLEALLAALRFEAYPEVPATLRALRARGHRLVVVSNWDVSLHEMLERTGLDELVDGALSSAEVGAPKPDPEIFRRALALAGCSAQGGLHVGDSLANDVAGAIAAGLQPVLVAREGHPDGVPAGVEVIGSLDELAALAA